MVIAVTSPASLRSDSKRPRTSTKPGGLAEGAGLRDMASEVYADFASVDAGYPQKLVIAPRKKL
jgi:hypothetical protein